MQAIGGVIELLILATAGAAVIYWAGLGAVGLAEYVYYRLRGSDNPAIRRYYGVGPRKGSK